MAAVAATISGHQAFQEGFEAAFLDNPFLQFTQSIRFIPKIQLGQYLQQLEDAPLAQTSELSQTLDLAEKLLHRQVVRQHKGLDEEDLSLVFGGDEQGREMAKQCLALLNETGF